MHAQTHFRSGAHPLTAEASEDETVGMGVVHQVQLTLDGAMLHQMTLAVGDANPLSFNAPRRHPIMLTYSIEEPASSFPQLKTGYLAWMQCIIIRCHWRRTIATNASPIVSAEEDSQTLKE